jgi:hypothetical protein
MEYYLVIKKKIMSFAGKWMELEITVLSTINQSACNPSYLRDRGGSQFKASPGKELARPHLNQ